MEPNANKDLHFRQPFLPERVHVTKWMMPAAGGAGLDSKAPPLDVSAASCISRRLKAHVAAIGPPGKVIEMSRVRTTVCFLGV